ncbi:MAG: DUF2505 domain-containing protein [Terracoccus sp.]
MRITEKIDYPAGPATVFAMLTTEAFQERKCAEAGALSHGVDITETGGGARIITNRDLPTDGLPDFAKSMVGNRLAITETYVWAAESGDGTRPGTLTVEVAGAPVALHATVRMAPGGSGTTIAIDGDLKASIPLFGGKVEKASAPAVIDAIRGEQRTGTAWLTENA